jgi:uncharacterized protein (DUF305 family)
MVSHHDENEEMAQTSYTSADTPQIKAFLLV